MSPDVSEWGRGSRPELTLLMLVRERTSKWEPNNTRNLQENNTLDIQTWRQSILQVEGLQRRHERRHICWLMALNLLYVFLASLACGEVSAEVAGVLGAISASEDSVLETVLGCEARGSVRP